MWLTVLLTICGNLVVNHSCAAEDGVMSFVKFRRCRNCSPNWTRRRKWKSDVVRRRSRRVFDVHVNTRRAVCTMDEKFLSFSIDAIEMKRKFGCFSTKSKKLDTLAKALSPAFLRIGGTPQDFMTFRKEEIGNQGETKNPNCTPHFENWKKMKPYVLPLSYFDEIGHFSQRNGLNLMFGLNRLGHQNADRSWNETSSLMLIHHAHENNFSVSWELGNEPNLYHRYGKSHMVTPQQLARDLQKLKLVVGNDKIVGPDVTASRKGLRYLKPLLRTEEVPVLDAITYHHYFMHQTVSTIQKYVNPVYLTQLELKMQKLRKAMQQTKSKTDLWLGEAGSSSGGGARNLSDTYASGFLYLGTLGLASKYCHKVVIRQSFYGGYYGMIDSATHNPLPDYWTSVLFKRLVGKISLAVQFDNKFANVQAYCNKQNPDDITLVVVNFGKRSTTFSIPKFRRHLGVKYVLTADNLQSKVVHLNGRALSLDDDFRLPTLDGEETTQPFHLPRRSYGFFVVKNVMSGTCRTL